MWDSESCCYSRLLSPGLATPEYGLVFVSKTGKEWRRIQRKRHVCFDGCRLWGQLWFIQSSELLLTRGWFRRNNDEALRLYKLAADEGNVHAQVRLGALYKTGLATEKMIKKPYDF